MWAHQFPSEMRKKECVFGKYGNSFDTNVKKSAQKLQNADKNLLYLDVFGTTVFIAT